MKRLNMGCCVCHGALCIYVSRSGGGSFERIKSSDFEDEKT